MRSRWNEHTFRASFRMYVRIVRERESLKLTICWYVSNWLTRMRNEQERRSVIFARQDCNRVKASRFSRYEPPAGNLNRNSHLEVVQETRHYSSYLFKTLNVIRVMLTIITLYDHSDSQYVVHDHGGSFVVVPIQHKERERDDAHWRRYDVIDSGHSPIV